MKYTLLDLVQTISSSIDSDEVNSITDSVESQQIATIVRSEYFDMLEDNNLPEHFDMINLQASGTSDLPVVMYVPTDVAKVLWVKYNKATVDVPNINMGLLKYISLQDFFDRADQLSESEDNVELMELTINGSTIPLLYQTDKHPEFYTSFDDKTMLFDSLDVSVDSYLISNKTLAAAKMSIPFSMTDSFIPDLDETQFNQLLNAAKSTAWLELRQTQHPKAERAVMRNKIRTQKTKVRVPGQTDFEKTIAFGRKR